MSEVRRYSSGRPWEVKFAHSRAISYGGVFETCLTSPSLPDGSIVGAGDVYAQTVRCLEIIRETMAQGPYGFADIVRTDVWMLNTLDWEKAAQAHRDLVGPDVRPVLSFIGCANFWHPDILVEVSVKAYRPPSPASP
jgi:enamine deaminase RidA (YjgF/YER057c/UK114 family)